MRIEEKRCETILTAGGSYETVTFLCDDGKTRVVNEIVKRFRCEHCGGWLNWIDGEVQCQDCGGVEFVRRGSEADAQQTLDVLNGLPQALRDAALANTRPVTHKQAPMLPIIIRENEVVDDDYDPDSAERFLTERGLLKTERSNNAN